MQRTFAIGDLQGCYDALRGLLDTLEFDPAHDRLWFCGDLVNRGPESLATLRFVKGLGDAAISLLGNHDLHLIALASGVRKMKKRDTLRRVVEAPDAAELIDWLCQRPLMHHDEALGWTMVHAGLWPAWDLVMARRLASEAEAAIRDPDRAFIQHLYGDEPRRWDPSLSGHDRIRFIVAAFTRMRFLSPDGGLNFKAHMSPAEHKGLTPWFDRPRPKHKGLRIVFGHWSTAGIGLRDDLAAIDTGALWGGALTALRVDGPPALTAFPCRQYMRPG